MKLFFDSIDIIVNLQLHLFLFDLDIWREFHRDLVMQLDYEEIRVYSMRSNVEAEIQNN
jgi:hypothetical protein